MVSLDRRYFFEPIARIERLRVGEFGKQLSQEIYSTKLLVAGGAGTVGARVLKERRRRNARRDFSYKFVFVSKGSRGL
jgi:hypothetical protein